ncbi:MAG: OmpA family protein [Bacteroidetes bacterium]|nr:OmpA family protein [Fibrella sp.]
MKNAQILILIALWLTSPVSLAQSGLKGEYFTGTNFEKKVLTRIDPQIKFDWNGRSPAPGIGLSYFSVRWTGKVYAPASGKYDFSATVDDGIRVWVDNQKIIDAWALHDDENFRGSITLRAGQYYDLRVEYFNDMLEGVIDLLWHRPDDANQQLVTLNKYGRPVVRPDGYRPVDAQYLYRTAPPAPKPVVAVAPKSKPKLITAAVVPKPKPVSKPVSTSVAIAKPRPAVVVVAAPSVTPPPAATLTAPEKKPVAETFGALETGKSLVLENVFFEQSKPVLLPESYAELDKLVRTLQQNPAMRIEIAGHTDNVGDPRLNQSLSEYRARVVMNYLTRHGIAGARVDAKGYGGSQPLTGNTTETERAKNRRVAFVVK